MNEQQVRALYAAAVAYDNRRGSEANITAWTEQALRNRWTFPDALEAIHQHYASSTEFLMPAHITAIIADRRNAPPTVDTTRAALPAAPPAERRRPHARPRWTRRCPVTTTRRTPRPNYSPWSWANHWTTTRTSSPKATVCPW